MFKPTWEAAKAMLLGLVLFFTKLHRDLGNCR